MANMPIKIPSNNTVRRHIVMCITMIVRSFRQRQTNKNTNKKAKYHMKVRQIITLLKIQLIVKEDAS